MITTRFAPSPTGYLHIGGLRTALLSWLWARKNGGKFILRIEDTDLKRNSDEATKAILEAFKWVGLDSDGEIYYQSKRFDIYRQYIDQLLDENRAYRCYMSKDELDELRETQKSAKERPRYDGRYRDFNGTPPENIEPVIRIKAPTSGTITVNDGIKGEVVFNVDDVLDDFIIARSDGTPTYNFVVAIDDALMGINEVIRGDDHFSNTPKQIVVYNALGFDLPKFYHVPMIHNDQGKKLSKRDGATDVMSYKQMGYLPEALLNFLIRLGWSSGDTEIFSKEQMLSLFNPSDINKSASIYNSDKLDWLNAHYIKSSPHSRLVSLLQDDFNLTLEPSSELLDALQERSKTIKELSESIQEIYTTPTEFDAKAIKKAIKSDSKEILLAFKDELNSTSTLDCADSYHKIIEKIVESKGIGFGKIGMPLRVALMGKLSGVGVDVIMSAIQKEETIKRVDALISHIDN